MPVPMDADIQQAFHQAVKEHDVEKARRMIAAGAGPDDAPDGNHTPLAVACRGGAADVAELLLKGGANPHAVEASRHNSVLMEAAEGNNPQCVRMLLACGVDVNHVNCDGETALLYAVLHGNAEIVSLLLEAGAAPNISESMLGTPVSIALERKDYHIARLLLRADARFRCQEEYYSPAVLECFDGPSLYYNMKHNGIAFRTDDEAVLLYAQHACTYLLRKALEAGADPNATDVCGMSVLDWALAHPRRPMGCAVKLIRHGAKFEPVLLIDAVCSRMRELVAVLLEAGADANARDGRGWAALHYAARMGADYFIRSLVAKGADIEARNHANDTPLLLAIRYRRFAAASALLVAGADVHAVGGKHNEDVSAACRRYHCRIDGEELLNAPWNKGT